MENFVQNNAIWMVLAIFSISCWVGAKTWKAWNNSIGIISFLCFLCSISLSASSVWWVIIEISALANKNWILFKEVYLLWIIALFGSIVFLYVGNLEKQKSDHQMPE